MELKVFPGIATHAMKTANEMTPTPGKFLKHKVLLILPLLGWGRNSDSPITSNNTYQQASPNLKNIQMSLINSEIIINYNHPHSGIRSAACSSRYDCLWGSLRPLSRIFFFKKSREIFLPRLRLVEFRSRSLRYDIPLPEKRFECSSPTRTEFCVR
jgi:hypothetical protein